MVTSEIHTVNMASGPKLYSFKKNTYYFGACHILNLSEEQRGKTLKISVDSGNRPVCWIELWEGAFDGGDWVKWTTSRGQLAVLRSGDQPQPDPSITWTIEPGDYTIYFVASSKVRETSDELITYRIEVVDS